MEDGDTDDKMSGASEILSNLCLRQRRGFLRTFLLTKLWYVTQIFPFLKNVTRAVTIAVGGLLCCRLQAPGSKDRRKSVECVQLIFL